jgi:hypothetical protein
MPAHDHNSGYVHKIVIRYDGVNLDEVKLRLKAKYEETEI